MTPRPPSPTPAHRKLTGGLCGALLWLAAGGCTDSDGTGPAAAAEPQGAGESAAASPTTAAESEPVPPAGTLERILYDKAQQYAAGLRPLAAAFDGTLEQGEHRDQLLVLDYGKCYRVVGAGGAEAEDLELVLYDPDNVQVQRDLAQDPYPVLGDQAEICPPMAGAYRLQVTMFKGRGRYLVRAYVLGE